MSNYAIVEIAGLQYKVAQGKEIEALNVSAKKDKVFKTDRVLLAKDGKKTLIGGPYVKGASVICDVLRDCRAEKKISFKYKKRKHSEWKKGHRQNACLLKVKEIKIEG